MTHIATVYGPCDDEEGYYWVVACRCGYRTHDPDHPTSRWRARNLRAAHAKTGWRYPT